ncbi:MAG: DUF2484 family protein [Pseudomonadota bacterium]|jgi:hypothetical protein|nr:DUF2484 family protein [Pseudomonadota bacterium]MEC8796955.1 DUF2484 family protein [Pseudomonadota bacterium]
MNLAFVLCCVWLIVANVIAMFPSRRKHWPAAYALMSVGMPLVAYVIWAEGIWWALLFMALAASVLRWPLVFALRWVRQQFG